MKQKHVAIVGGGFAGMSCAHTLVREGGVHVTLIDKNNYHEFTPLLYQVATALLPVGAVATSFRDYFRGKKNIDIKMAEVRSIDPKTNKITVDEQERYQADTLVLAAGSVVNFFNTPGAQEGSLPLYNLSDAERLRSQILFAFERADRNPELAAQGILNFVIIGAGPTGTELAGSIADMISTTFPKEFFDLAIDRARIYVIDHSPSALHTFSEESQRYATTMLEERGIQLRLGLLVKEVGSNFVLLSNGERIASQTIIWAGGVRAAPLCGHCQLTQGHGGRINVLEDLSVQGFPQIYAIGDFANIPSQDGAPLPQLASVAQQAGVWAAQNILAEMRGQPRRPFQYHDRGILAMIGKNAAVAELGRKRRKLRGILAFLAWLAIHSALLPTLTQRIKAILEWCWEYCANRRDLQILDRADIPNVTNEVIKEKGTERTL